MSKHIALLSGKGGTGKTTLAINLATALHRLGEDSLLIDANLNNPHVGFSLGQGHLFDTIHDVLADRIAPIQAIAHHDEGFRFVPGDPHPKGLLLDKKSFDKFKSMAADIVLYDGPPGDHDAVLAAADQLLIITNPDFPSLVDANRILAQAEYEQKIVAGVVLNKVTRNSLSNEQVEMFLNTPVIANIPFDERFEQALHRKVPFCSLHGKQPAAKAIQELAARIAGKPHL